MTAKVFLIPVSRARASRSCLLLLGGRAWLAGY